MLTKTKTKKHTSSFDLELGFERLVSRVGFVAMTAAAVLSVVEIEHLRSQKIEVLQPAFATVSNSPVETNKGEEMMRREKEESPHSVVSYGVTMRSHATAGKR